MVKRAFVFSGEGARGAYQAAVAFDLSSKGIRPDALYGISSGAICATGYGYLGASRLFGEWEKINSIKDVFKSNGLMSFFRPGLYRHDILFKKIETIVQANKEPLPVTVGYVDLYTDELVFVNNMDYCNSFSEAVIASAAIPGLIEPVKGRYVDGGVKMVAPLKQAINDGCDEIYVIVGTPLNSAYYCNTYKETPLGVATMSLELAMKQMLMNDIRLAIKCNELKGFRKVDIKVLGPISYLYGSLEFDKCKVGLLKGTTEYYEINTSRF